MDYEDTKVLWVWLTQIFPYSSMKIAALIDVYTDIEDIYNEEKYYEVRFNDSEIRALKNKNLDDAYKIIEKTKAVNAEILTYDDDMYPENLRHIPDRPYVLYVKGKIIEWDKYLLISIIGKRDCSEYGIAATRKIAGELAQMGVVIVSGLARGLDAAASIEALRYNRYSIGILGCAIDNVYPKENKILYDAIEKTGTIISEYPPGSNPGKQGFVLRNRLIAGFSNGLLVVEAAEKSGTKITVNYAYEYGRDVFAVPGSIFNKNCEGTNRMLMGSAKAVIGGKDIMVEYPYAVEKLKAPMGNIYLREIPEIGILIGGNINSEERLNVRPYAKNYTASNLTEHRRNAVSEKKIKEQPSQRHNEEEQRPKINAEKFSGTEKLIIDILLKGEKQKDEIIREIAADAGEVNTALIMLEMQGAVKQIPGNIYKLK